MGRSSTDQCNSVLASLLGLGIAIAVALLFIFSDLATSVILAITIVFLAFALYNVCTNRAKIGKGGEVLEEARMIRWKTVGYFVLATYDFATDILFLDSMRRQGYTVYFGFGIAAITVSMIANTVTVMLTLRGLLCDTFTGVRGITFKYWAEINPFMLAVVSFISVTRTDALAFMVSNCRVPCIGLLDAPMSLAWRSHLDQLGLVSVLVEDAPQLMIQASFLAFQSSTGDSAVNNSSTAVGGNSYDVAVLSLFFTGMNVCLQVFLKIMQKATAFTAKEVYDTIEKDLKIILWDLEQKLAQGSDEYRAKFNAETNAKKVITDCAKHFKYESPVALYADLHSHAEILPCGQNLLEKLSPTMEQERLDQINRQRPADVEVGPMIEIQLPIDDSQSGRDQLRPGTGTEDQQQASSRTFQKCLSESGHSLELAAMSRADPLWPSKESLQPSEFIRAMLKDDEVRTGCNFRCTSCY